MRALGFFSALAVVLLASSLAFAAPAQPTAEETAFAARVEKLAKAGKGEEAEKLCRDEIAGGALRAQAQLSLGLLLAERARVTGRVVPAGGAEDLEKAFASDSEGLARMGTGETRGLATGEAAEAAEALEKAVELAPKRFEAYAALTDLYSELRSGERERLNAARMLDVFGTKGEAPAAIQRAAQRRVKAGDDAGAEALLKVLADRAPEDATLQSDLGVLALRRGAHGEAADRFERAVSLDPKDDVALLNLAHVRLLRQETDRAVDAYARLVLLKPKDDVARYESALALSLTDPARSAKEWDEYLRLAEKDDPFRTAAGEIREHVLGKRLRTERRWIEEARRMQKDAPYYGVAGLLHALKADPDSLEANYTMAGVYDLLRFSDWSLKYLGRCRDLVRLNPSYADILPWSVLQANFGRAYYQGARYEEAAASYRDALKAGAEPSEANYSIGAAYERLGRLADAGRAYRAAADSGGPYAEKASRKLDRPDVREALSGGGKDGAAP